MASKKKNNAQKKGKLSPADQLKEEGNLQLRLENYEKATELYSQAIEIDSSQFAYFHNRSLVYFLREQFEKSLKDAQTCRSLNKDYVPAYVREASALLELDQLEQAKKVALEGLVLDVKNAEIKSVVDIIEKEMLSHLEERSKVSAQSLGTESRLLEWLRENNCEFESVRLRYEDESNRSVVSRRVINVGDTIIRIPIERVAITLEMAKESLKSLVKDQHVVLTSEKHISFTLFLLNELHKQEASQIKPYLDSLPRDLSNFPAMFSDEDLSWLNGSNTLHLITEQKEDMKKDYMTLCKIDDSFSKNFSFEQFRWAQLISHSRLFSVNINQIKTSLMVPLADMLNHAPSGTEEVEWVFDNSTKSFLVKAVRHIQKGQEIRFTYGSKCNSKLFVNYGFIEQSSDQTIESKEPLAKFKPKTIGQVEKLGNVEYKGINQFNELPILFSYDSFDEDKTLPLKSKLLGSKEQTGIAQLPKVCMMRINQNYESANSTGFLGYLRFITIRDPKQLIKLDEAHQKYILQTNQPNLPFLPQKTPPLSIENEIAMWTRVQELFVPILLAHKQSVIKDTNLLKSSHDLTRNQLCCLQVRLGEKMILEYYIDMASKMMNLLENKDKKDILESSRNDPALQPYFHYILQVILSRLLYQK